jgi:hypothetical protein
VTWISSTDPHTVVVNQGVTLVVRTVRGRSVAQVEDRRDRWPALLYGGLAVLAGLVYRVCLLGAATPATNSDEATMGLAALHISTGRHLPAFFYGQAYMGTAEAYLAVPVFWLLGPSTTALRLPLLVLYAAFAAGVFVLVRMLFTAGLAVFTTALLALGSDRVVRNQMVAAGGYPEINAVGVWLLVLSVRLATGRTRMAPLPMAGWGLVVGLLLWIDWLILPYVAAAAVILVAGRWAQLRAATGLWLATAGGLVVGALPLIMYNLTRPFAENSIAVFLGQSRAADDASAWDLLYGGVALGLSMGGGTCSPHHCATWQMWWSAAYVVLLVAAVALAVRRLRATPAPNARERVVEIARLALLGAAALSVVSYARSFAPASAPIENARYLSATLISLPAILWPLWMLATGRRGRRALAAVATAILIGLAATTAAASAALVAAADTYTKRAENLETLVETLAARDIRHIYTDYWTCDLVAFATEERTVCAVLSDGMRTGLNRYEPYRDRVARADKPAYVVPANHVLAGRIRAWLDSTGVPYRSTTVGWYVIFEPARAVHPDAQSTP